MWTAMWAAARCRRWANGWSIWPLKVSPRWLTCANRTDTRSPGRSTTSVWATRTGAAAATWHRSTMRICTEDIRPMWGSTTRMRRSGKCAADRTWRIITGQRKCWIPASRVRSRVMVWARRALWTASPCTIMCIRADGRTKEAPRSSTTGPGIRRWPKRPISRSWSNVTARSWISTIRRRRSVWSWTSGDAGSMWSRGRIRDSCISRIPCGMRW